MRWNFIYTLTDPRNGRVRYIGCCSNPFWCEMRHRSLGSGKHQKRLKNWIRELREYGFRPAFAILQKVPFYLAHEIETSYIRSYADAFPDLLNVHQRQTVSESLLKDFCRSKAKKRRYRREGFSPLTSR